MSDRYAVYLAPPPESDLWRFGSRVLGRDAVTGEEIQGFAPEGVTAEAWRAMTEAPRRYGFHATLKAPFRLKAGCTPRDLEDALAALAAATPAFDLGPLHVSPLAFAGGGFVALTPRETPPALRELEARAVRELDQFRAEPKSEELAHRRPDRLTPRQRELLREFGYPFVLDEFRPHFTLTGALEAVAPIAKSLSRAHAQAVAAPDFRVDALVLFVQRMGEAFLVSKRFDLTYPGNAAPECLAPALTPAAGDLQRPDG